jgi:lipopolysaccharide transport system ATP-binding protein
LTAVLPQFKKLMRPPVVQVNKIGKAYKLGQPDIKNAMFRDALLSTLKAPFRRLSELRRSTEGVDLFWALKNVSFDLHEGEVVGVIGRNGAGKSTLLKILSRITEPTEGQVTLRGRVASLLEVGTGFHPELTGRENIYLNGAILGMSKTEIDRKFDEIVAFSEIERFLDTPVKRYSSGMYVRLAFAVAAHLEPEILIVDEVLAVGDAAFQAKCLGKMKEVSRASGRTIVFVSHNMPAVRALCTRCILVDSGKILFDGGTEEGTHHYIKSNLPSGFDAVVRYSETANEEPRMTCVKLMNGGEPATAFNMGDELTLEVEYLFPYRTTSPKLGFIISTEEGYPVVNANNRYQRSQELESPCNRGRFRCELGQVPLMPGEYAVSLWFGDSVQDTHVVENALRFRVIENDLWGMGRVPPTNASVMWWPTKFNVYPIREKLEVSSDH